ncbi:hypothetical protein PIB30_028122 [Stylosanthes scabra]|uniref:Uncharacterized protein n=1 Tax=Stylosanthes scabra TaxID=79078 RepID=A0ABU6U9P4_9FABA|nr:hypothetical protein [Stylosanthes scabra]
MVCSISKEKLVAKSLGTKIFWEGGLSQGLAVEDEEVKEGKAPWDKVVAKEKIFKNRGETKKAIRKLNGVHGKRGNWKTSCQNLREGLKDKEDMMEEGNDNRAKGSAY